MDVKLMLQALQTTMEFEGKLDKRFSGKDFSDLLGAAAAGEVVQTSELKFYK
ncbi:hypothetical protein HK102_006911, partial [Quaeritorhiza haematococci]